MNASRGATRTRGWKRPWCCHPSNDSRNDSENQKEALRVLTRAPLPLIRGVSRFRGQNVDPSDTLKGKKIHLSYGGRRCKTRPVGAAASEKMGKSWEESREGRSQPSEVTVAVPGDRCLGKPSAPNFRETPARLALRASAFHFSKQPLATSPSGSSSQRLVQRRDRVNSTLCS